jgi:hypothetical protein
MTDENGATVYGTCIVFYEKLPCHLKEPIDQCLKDWKDVSLVSLILDDKNQETQ